MGEPNPYSSAEIAVDRAGHELRRGRMILIAGSDGTFVAGSAEQFSLADVPLWRRRDGASLALTAKRAAALHIAPTGDSVILLPLMQLPDAAGMTDAAMASLVTGLSDATTDLRFPMRGPFIRIKAAAPDAVHGAVILAKAARLLPSVLVAPASGQEAGLLRIETSVIRAAARQNAAGLREVAHARLPLSGAENCRIMAFRPADGGLEHFAIIVGEPNVDEAVLVRLHSECFTGDLLGSLKCDCGEQLRGAITTMHEAGAGVVLYLAQEGRGIGLINKLKAYQLQDQGFDTVDANERLGFESDERIFAPAAAMLAHLGIGKVKLLTNNPDKVAQLEQEGVAVIERVPHAFPSNNHNEAYLAVKKRRSGHYL